MHSSGRRIGKRETHGVNRDVPIARRTVQRLYWSRTARSGNRPAPSLRRECRRRNRTRGEIEGRFSALPASTVLVGPGRIRLLRATHAGRKGLYGYTAFHRYIDQWIPEQGVG